MSDKKKETFTITKEVEGQKKSTTYAIVTPTPEQGRKAAGVYSVTFSEALENKGLLRKRVHAYMLEQGLWNDEKENEKVELIDSINELDLTLQKGGIKLTEARQKALEMRILRVKLRNLMAEKNELDADTVQGRADNARFNSLVSQCLVYNDTGKPVYSSMDEYLENSTEEVAYTGAQTLAIMMYEFDKSFDFKLPENKFLKTWKFVDDELRLINKDEHLIDTEGNLINEDGKYVNEDGDFTDKDGNLVDEEGNYIVESSPFLDDDGDELTPPEVEDKTDDGDDEDAVSD